MIKSNENGTVSFISDEDAVKLEKYEEIVKVLSERSPYGGNRTTCDIIREIVARENKR